jgi:DNA-binding transcriptional LysR family regulator
VELRDIEIFLVLAEELHFGRTAERLNLSQSRITRSVQGMERQVGGVLFDRTSRSVRLSTLGAQLRDEMAPAYTNIHSAMEHARTTASGTAGRLRIGLWSMPSGGAFLTRIIQEFRESHPGWQVELVGSAPLRQVEALRAGQLDMLVLWLPVDEPDLVVGPVLSTQERIVGMGTHHPLASRDFVSLEDIAEYEVVSFYGVPPASLYSLVPANAPSGRPIRRRGEVRDRMELTNLIALGEVLHGTVAATPQYVQHPDVMYRPLRGLPPARSALVWHDAAQTPHVRAFADIAERFVPAE